MSATALDALANVRALLRDRTSNAVLGDGTMLAICECPQCAYGSHDLTAVSTTAARCDAMIWRKFRKAHPLFTMAYYRARQSRG